MPDGKGRWYCLHLGLPRTSALQFHQLMLPFLLLLPVFGPRTSSVTALIPISVPSPVSCLLALLTCAHSTHTSAHHQVPHVFLRVALEGDR